MSVQYLPKYGFYLAEIGNLQVYGADRLLAMQQVLAWFIRQSPKGAVQ